MAGEQIARVLNVEIANSIRRALADEATGVGKLLEAFVAGMDVGAKGDMARVNGQIAADVRQAVRDAYDETVESQRKVEPYPRFNRLSGHLGRVIRRNDLVQSDHTGIAFINKGALDKEAEHWRRLNFGAGEAAGSQPAPRSVRLFGQAVVNISLPYGPSPAFVLPKGFFLRDGVLTPPSATFRGQGTRRPFYPNRKSPYEPAVTAGIRGRHFLEAGLEVMEREFPIRYADLLNEWILRGGRKAKAVSGVLG